MKILVPTKFAVDYNIRVHVKADGSGVETDNLKHSVNPFDEIALEEAIRLKEKGIASEVIAVTIGGNKAEEALRHCLAIGADSATHITCEQAIEPIAAAQILGAYFKQVGAHFVLMGKQAIDDDYNQTGQMLAAQLDLPQVTFISELNVEGDQITALREVDEGLVKAKLSLPCIATVDLRLNEPRYPTLPNIMKAKSKPIEKIEVSAFDVDVTPKLNMTAYETPNMSREGKTLNSADELVELIKAKVAEL